MKDYLILFLAIILLVALVAGLMFASIHWRGFIQRSGQGGESQSAGRGGIFTQFVQPAPNPTPAVSHCPMQSPEYKAIVKEISP